MDPTVASILAALLSFLSTFGMMYASYHWPVGRNKADDDRVLRRDEDEDDDEDDDSDDDGPHRHRR